MRGLAALVLVIALVVSGCGGEDDPQPAPSPTKSSSPSETTPTPPEMPEAATATNRAGAIAFAKYYVELINHAQATGELAALEAVEAEGCKSCARARRYVQELYAEGGSLRGGSFEVMNESAQRNPATDGWLVMLGVRFGPQVVDRPGSGRDERLKGGRLPLNIQVGSQGGDWRVLEWTRGA